MATNKQPDLNLSAEALRMAELHEQLAIDYQLELTRAKEPLRRIYLQQMIERQRNAAVQHREMIDRMGG